MNKIKIILNSNILTFKSLAPLASDLEYGLMILSDAINLAGLILITSSLESVALKHQIITINKVKCFLNQLICLIYTVSFSYLNSTSFCKIKNKKT